MLIKITLYLVFGFIVLVANDQSTAQILSREILIFSGGFVLDLIFTTSDKSNRPSLRITSGILFVISIVYLIPFITKLAVPTGTSSLFPQLQYIYINILSYSEWAMGFPLFLLVTEGWDNFWKEKNDLTIKVEERGVETNVA